MAKITVNVDIDLDEVFSEIEDDKLTQEMIDRGLETPRIEDEMFDKVATLELLREASDMFRKNDKINLAVGIDQLIEDLYL